LESEELMSIKREKRRGNRNPALKPTKFFLTPSIIDKAYEGIITDISDSGACLLTSIPLKDRQRIIIQDKACSYEQAAIVRWSQKYDEMFYKIGLEFIEDQTFMYIHNKRRYKRLNIKNLDLHKEITSAHYIKIVDISYEGLMIETNKKWGIGEEFIFGVEYEGKQWPFKGYIVRIKVKERKKDDKGNTFPVYTVGIKLTSFLDKNHEFYKIIRQKLLTCPTSLYDLQS
jgi:hypothetical protein